MRPPMHFTACDDVDSRLLLFHNRSLSGAKLGVGEIGRRKIAQGNQAIQRLIPARYAMSADNGGGVFSVVRHWYVVGSSRLVLVRFYMKSPQILVGQSNRMLDGILF